ncbi:MAG TPA: hypothetical protein VIJ99_06875 [Acidimicrobiales bacterium]
MKSLRLVLAALLLTALFVASTRTSSSATNVPPQPPCSTDALSLAFTGDLHVTSFQNFGCEGDWAFAWTTVGSGEHAIGVTEVLEYSQAAHSWSLVSRATDCKPLILPTDIYKLGCFSN